MGLFEAEVGVEGKGSSGLPLRPVGGDGGGGIGGDVGGGGPVARVVETPAVGIEAGGGFVGPEGPGLAAVVVGVDGELPGGVVLEIVCARETRSASRGPDDAR